jgi:hypothetical protein
MSNGEFENVQTLSSLLHEHLDSIVIMLKYTYDVCKIVKTLCEFLPPYILQFLWRIFADHTNYTV